MQGTHDLVMVDACRADIDEADAADVDEDDAADIATTVSALGDGLLCTFMASQSLLRPWQDEAAERGSGAWHIIQCTCYDASMLCSQASVMLAKAQEQVSEGRSFSTTAGGTTGRHGRACWQPEASRAVACRPSSYM